MSDALDTALEFIEYDAGHAEEMAKMQHQLAMVEEGQVQVSNDEPCPEVAASYWLS